MRRRGADCFVVVRHRLCRPTANETLVSHCRLVGIELRRRVCFFVVMKRGNARGAKGAGHRHLARVNRQREEPDVQWKAAAFARWHEPDDARGSSPVLGEARGEIPRAYSAVPRHYCPAPANGRFPSDTSRNSDKAAVTVRVNSRFMQCSKERAYRSPRRHGRAALLGLL